MLNANQYSIVCETLYLWAAEFAVGNPPVHSAIYNILAMLALEYETQSALRGSPLAPGEPQEESEENCEEICAELVSLEPAMGLSGAIIPVAGIRNNELDYSTVFRCRVPHWGIPEYLGLHRGCTVALRKEMGKSPELAACMDTGRRTRAYSPLFGKWVPPEGHSLEIFVRPEACPYCGHALVHRECPGGHELLACVNSECKTQIGDRVLRFVKVGGMGIPGITEEVVEQLLMEGKLDTVESLYSLTVKDFMDACHVSYTDAYLMVKSVERSKIKPMHMLVDAMGIPGITREISPVVAACITWAGGMGSLVSDDPETVARSVTRLTTRALKVGLSETAVKQVVDYFFKNRTMVRKFVELGVAQVSVPLVCKEKARRIRGKKLKRRKPRGKTGDDGGEPG